MRPLFQVSPWVDGRFRAVGLTYEQIEAQTHRRFLKAHLPIDGLPLYDDVKYIHVARDGRDAVMSIHNQYRSHTDAQRETLSKIGAEDSLIGRPFPLIPQRPAEFFRLWLTTPTVAGQADGLPNLSYFDFEAGSGRSAIARTSCSCITRICSPIARGKCGGLPASST